MTLTLGLWKGEVTSSERVAVFAQKELSARDSANSISDQKIEGLNLLKLIPKLST